MAAAILGETGGEAKPLWNADLGKEFLPEGAESIREPDRTRGVGQQDVGRPGSAVRRRLCRVSPRCEEGSTRNARLRAPAGEGIEGNDSSLRRWSDAPSGIPASGKGLVGPILDRELLGWQIVGCELGGESVK
jgi:hypothetical protein